MINNKKISAFLLSLFIAFEISAQADLQRLKKDVYTLSADSFMGRKPYNKGDSLSEAYILQQINNTHARLLNGKGLQEVKFVSTIEITPANYCKIGNTEMQLRRDFVPALFSKSEVLERSAIFAGYGLYSKKGDSVLFNYYSKYKVEGVWVIILRGAPEKFKISKRELNDRAKVLTAKDNGAAGVLLISEKGDLPDQNYDKVSSDAGIPVIYITKETFELLCKETKNNADSLIYKSSLSKIFTPINLKTKVAAKTDLRPVYGFSNNIIAITDGSDNILKNEYVVVGAHYDHLGFGGAGSGSRKPDTSAVHNGADDNASGVAGVLELMRLIENSKEKPKRSIVWVAFTGEEMGLLGSKEFVQNSPIDLTKITAMINLDMIGRLNDTMPRLSLSGTGTGDVLDKMVDSLSKNVQFSIKKNPDGYGPSDHASFYSKKIPVLFLNSGIHMDYHTPFDDRERINYKGMVEIVDFTEKLICATADYKGNIEFKETRSKQEQSYRDTKITLGIIPDVTGGTEGGLLVEGVKAGGYAEKGGMMKGDIIVAMDGKEVKNIYDYMSRLNQLESGKTIHVEVIRKGKREVLLIQL